MKSSILPFFKLSLTATLVSSAFALLFFTLQSQAIIQTNLQMQLGNPSGATANTNNHDHYLLQRAVEALDFSDNLGEPNWVSWDLTAADLGGSGRNSSFYPDTNLPPNFYYVVSDDYTNVGYDRGHMCPSADRTDTTNDNKLVFRMDNIIPQTDDQNTGPWESLETYTRSFCTNNEILITCGPSTFDGSRIEPSGKASIPQYTWKIIVIVPNGSGTALSRITSTTRVITVKMPNITGIHAVKWTNYITSVNRIQADTGFTFFTALSPTIATALRAEVDGGVDHYPPVGSLNISQVYGGGGNSGATYKNDFIELYNGSSATVDLSTYAVQYTSASGTSWSVTPLSGSVLPGHYYLIQEAAGSGGTTSLPTPEAIGTIAMAATAGKVALTKTTTALTVDNPVGNTNLVDFVGYGTADAYEGTGPAPAPSNTTADLRAGSGATDTNDNATDFSAGTPNPRN